MNALERWSPLSGVIAVVLVVVGILMWSTPDYDDTAAWAAHFEDGGNRVQSIASAIIIALSGSAFLVFFWSLAGRLGAAEDGQPRLANLGVMGGVLFAGALGITAAALGSVPGGHEFGDAPLPNPDLMIQIDNLATGILVIGGGFAASLTVGAFSIAALRGGGLPRWLGWLGVAFAVLLLFSVLLVPLLLLPLWVLIASITLLRRSEA